jgi:argininosuccinate synthase
MTVPPERAPDQSETVEVEFRGGNPIAVNGKQLPPGELIAELNKIGRPPRCRRRRCWSKTASSA